MSESISEVPALEVPDGEPKSLWGVVFQHQVGQGSIRKASSSGSWMDCPTSRETELLPDEAQ